MTEKPFNQTMDGEGPSSESAERHLLHALSASKKAFSFPRLAVHAAGPLTPGHPARGASTLLEALEAMKRSSSDNHFSGHSDSSSWADDVVLGDRRRAQSPDTTLGLHSKQSSQESLESQAEDVLRAMKSSSNLGSHPCSFSPCPTLGRGEGQSSPPAECPLMQHDQPQMQGRRQQGTTQPYAAASMELRHTHDSGASCSPPATAASSSQQLAQGHEHERGQAKELCTAIGLPGCHSMLSNPGSSKMLARSFSEPQHEPTGSTGLSMGPQGVQGPDGTQLPPASTSQATSNHQAAPSLAISSRSSRRSGTSHAMHTAAPSTAPFYLAPSHLPKPMTTNPYLIPRSHISSPAPQPISAISTTSAPAPSGHLAPSSFESSSSDDCEEVTRRITAAFPRLHARSHERHKSWSAFGGRGSEPEAPRLLRSQEGSLDGSSGLSLSLEEAELLERRKNRRGNYHLTGPAAAELLLRLNHARQTVDFVKRQAALFSSLNRASMDVWEALEMLDGMHGLQSAGTQGQTGSMSPKDLAFQTAELCRLSHPDLDWLHLVGLMHGLGRLLAHRMFGSQPDWATLGESFPLGCRFDPRLQGAQFFSVNPDRRRRMYNSPLGIYPPGCGLRNVYMSWSAAEYMYLMLLLNDTRLPPEALFMIRHQKFTSLTSGNGAYRELLSPADEALLPLLASFQQLCVQRRVTLPPDKIRSREEQQLYYSGLVSKYIGKDRKLSW